MDEMKQNISIVLINTHFSQGNVRPNVPAFVEIGGIQARSQQLPLPIALQTLLDTSIDGVIYFSMGTNVKSTDLSQENLLVIKKVFRKFRQQVIWKFENETIDDLPQNVYISKWLPQNDILAHKNIKLFITHGGLGSMIEARYHGVPILGIPVYGDQMANIDMAVNDGWAIKIDYANLREETLSNGIYEILHNSKYSDKIKYLSSIYRDRPITPLENAVFWTEYVIRHRGARHIQSNSIHLNFFQLHSLDVVGLLCIITLFVMIINIVIMRWCFRKLFMQKVKTHKKIE